MEAIMKALAIIALALALEAGFLLQVALPGPAEGSATPARLARSAEAHRQPLAVGAGLIGSDVPCAR
jgi:hypothetical protein